MALRFRWDNMDQVMQKVTRLLGGDDPLSWSLLPSSSLDQVVSMFHLVRRALKSPPPLLTRCVRWRRPWRQHNLSLDCLHHNLNKRCLLPISVLFHGSSLLHDVNFLFCQLFIVVLGSQGT